MGEEGEFLSEGLDWRRRSTPWLISAGEGEEGKWIQEVSVIRETKPNVQVRLRDRCKKRKQHTSLSLLSFEICKLLIQNTIPRSFLPAQDRWPESHFHCSATLSWQLIWNSAISNPLHTVCQGIMYITGFTAPLIWQIPWFLKPKNWRHCMKAWVSVLWEPWEEKYNEDLDYRRQ